VNLYSALRNSVLITRVEKPDRSVSWTKG